MSDRLAQLTKLHQTDPDDPFCTYGIAMEHAKAGQHDEALEWLDKTLAADKLYCYAYYQKAKTLSELGRADDANDAISAGIEAAKQAGDNHAQQELAELMDAIGG
jgi:tetratricopeptide (TPR) repeat protein